MFLNLEEVKSYLRVDEAEDDDLITTLLESAEELCTEIVRELPETIPVTVKIAVLYAVAYLYEHREEADHKELTQTLKSLLSPLRKEVF